ncbi:MAG: HAD family phosphatase [Oscillospiraceae bacterium]|nr:HAD family phosphatase [Oscillospiraceae bacterium]
MIKFAIFDLDGTLLDSSEMWRTLGARYLSFLKKTPEPGLNEALNEMTMPMGAQYLREHYNIAYSSEEIVRHLTRMIESYYAEEVNLKDGAPKLLAALRTHCVHMSIATSSDERLAMMSLMRLGVGDFFAGAVSCSNYGAKTSPDVYLAAADLIYAIPEETVVFEDSLFAVRTARKAGFATAAVMDISESDQEGLKRASDFYTENLEDFADDIGDILSFERNDS